MKSFSSENEQRREFLIQCVKTVAGITVLGVVSPIIQGCKISSSPPDKREIVVDVTALIQAPTGTPYALEVPVTDLGLLPVYIIKNAQGDIIALNSQCTHQACQIKSPEADHRFHARPDDFTDEIDKMYCDCHGSTFNLDGVPLQGPATVALHKYETTLDTATNQLTILIQ